MVWLSSLPPFKKRNKLAGVEGMGGLGGGTDSKVKIEYGFAFNFQMMLETKQNKKPAKSLKISQLKFGSSE